MYCYNDERPQEALDMRVPADDDARSPRGPYRGISELEYPCHDWTAIVERSKILLFVTAFALGCRPT